MTRILPFWSGKTQRPDWENNFVLLEKKVRSCFFVLRLSHFVSPILLFPICPVQIVGLSGEANTPCVNTS